MRGYPQALIRATLGASRTGLSQRYSSIWNQAQGYSPQEISAYQLRAFNLEWGRAQSLSFYQHWMQIHGLPERILSLSDLDQWPLLTKDALREYESLLPRTPDITGAFRTSGSTGSPFSFPRSQRDLISSYARTWTYRQVHGLRPFMPFLLASSTLGSSAHNRMAYLKSRSLRIAKDLAGNSWTTSGLITNPQQADAALAAIRLLQPRYLAGYTSALTMIAQRAEDLGWQLPDSLTHVIPTSETVTAADAACLARLGQVVIEYGAIETGVIAATICADPRTPGWPVTVLWPWTLLRTSPSGAVISTLSGRAFPLIHYCLGDDVNVSASGPGGTVLELAGVEGRVRDIVSLPLREGEMTVRACELSMLVRNIPGIISAQVAQTQSANGLGIDIAVICPNPSMRHAVAESARHALHIHHPHVRPGAVRLRFVDSYVPAARGKRSVCVPADRVAEDAPAIVIS